MDASSPLRIAQEQGAGIAYALKGLSLAATVLHIGAHPDDEDVGTIAYLARGIGARAVYWSATRGEGSQNQAGNERAEALGILRTWESLAARAIDGGEVLYGPFYDFGFSKTAVDTFVRWSREEVVLEVARAIRLVQPLVVISRWTGDLGDGHGQHQAVGQTVREAWDLAADPSALPSLGLPAWEPRKLYRSLAGDWQPGEDADPGALLPELEQAGHLRIDTGQVDQISGLSFQQLGHLAINQHRSQGMRFTPDRGSHYYYYQRELNLEQPVDREVDFFDGLEPRLRGLAQHPGGGAAPLRDLLVAIDDAIDDAIEAFRPGRAADAGEALLGALAALSRARGALREALADAEPRAALDRYLSRKERDIADVAARCLGLRLECLIEQHQTSPGGRVRVSSRVWTSGTVDPSVGSIELRVPPQWRAEAAAPPPAPEDEGAAAVVHHDVTVAEHQWTAAPYWLRTPRRPYRYVWPRRGPLSMPFAAPLVQASAELDVGGRTLHLHAPGHHRRAVPGGVASLPLNVLPPIVLVPQNRRLLIPADDVPAAVQLPVLARCLRAQGVEATIGLACPAGWKVEPATADLGSMAAGAERTIDFHVEIPAGTPAAHYTLRYLVVTGGAPYGVELEPVRIGLGPGAPTEATCVAETFVTRPSAVDVHIIDARFVREHRYGYVPGLAEEIVPALGRFGLDITLLPAERLAFTELTGYDAIVVGPNAYNVPSVRAGARRLLEYVGGGGTLVVQHQTYGYDERGLAPYPFAYNQPHDRVTLASAPIEPLAPDHPALNQPNTIAQADWDGWVHDRGIYFFGTWDQRYTPILSSNDPGEAPRLGGLMVASFGKGIYVYSGYSFARQIPAGVQGAVRLFANLLGLAESKMRELAGRLRSDRMLDFLSDDELAFAARWIAEKEVRAGMDLVSPGDGDGAICIGVDVDLEVWRDHAGGERLVRTVPPGEAVGGYEALCGDPLEMTLRSRAAGHVLELPGGVLRDWLCADRALSERLVRSLAAELIRRGS